ncbi:MAG: hypothetical protein ACHQX1_02295, partial [Candidatus Micrarchaeales archaeon]
MLNQGGQKSKAQIAFEFLVVYSFVLIIFVVIFMLVTSQRASALNAQGYSSIQLIAQDVAGYIDQAVYAGSGYNATVPLIGSIGTLPYNITISSTGVVIVSSKIGTQVITAQAYSNARNLLINGTYSKSASSNAISLIVLPNADQISIANLNGVVYIDQNPNSQYNFITYLAGRLNGKTQAAVFNGLPAAANTFTEANGVSLLNNVPAWSISAWIYDTGLGPANQVIYSEASANNG